MADARRAETLHEWTVAGAIVERPAPGAATDVLLVRNVRRDGSTDWSPPGGVIEVHAGEVLLDGLTREVAEETGLVVTAWSGPLYEVTVTAPGLGWRLRVEVHRADAWEGVLAVDDPDGIVTDAHFVHVGACAERCGGAHPWVHEPLADWLGERWDGSRPYGYRVDGARCDLLHVTRVP